MGNVAADMVIHGFKVTGSDVGVYSPMKEFLADKGIKLITPYQAENLKGTDIIIVGNAISRGNPELEEALRRRLTLISMSELLKWGLLLGRKNIVISGTHGKTTTTALTAHILAQGGYEPGYMIGGVPMDFASGFSSAKGEYFVIEGDEYDIAYFDKRPKFLLYLPFVVVVNNLEYDHSDIYHNLPEIQECFRKLVRLIPDNGFLVVNGDDDNCRTIIDEARCRVIRFGLNEDNDFLSCVEEGYMSIIKNGISWEKCPFALPGEFNIRNALAAAAALEVVGIERQIILQGISSFKGVKRRMEFKGEYQGIALYDDFAHHPTAVKASIQTIRKRHPGRRIWALFHPRSNTCVTNLFQDRWPEAFSEAHKVVIAELHRKDKIPPQRRLSRETVKRELENKGIDVFLWDTADDICENIAGYLEAGDVILMMSNSDFGGLAGKLMEVLQKKQ